MRRTITALLLLGLASPLISWADATQPPSPLTAEAKPVLTAPAKPVTYPHPLIADTISFPGEKVPNSRFAAYLAAALLLTRGAPPVTDAPPLPGTIPIPTPDFAEKGEPFWEIRFFSSQSKGHLIARVLVNARTGMVKMSCYQDCG
jgi:hypothetical protein